MGMKQTRVVDCATVLPGFAVKSAVVHAPGGRYQLIQGRHLTPGVPYRFTEQDSLRMSPRRRPSDERCVYAGDVLFASRGGNNYAVCLEAVPEPSIAPATFYILRPAADTDAHYLAWCINQAPVQAAIAQIRTGAATPIVQRDAFAGIMIPLPALDEQRRIARLAALMNRERGLLRQLAEETEHYHALIGRRLLAAETAETAGSAGFQPARGRSPRMDASRLNTVT